MALTPLKLADVQIGAALTENWGRPSAYFQRYLQENNAATTASIAGLAAALAELAAQQAQLTAQQATLTAQQATLTAQGATLTATVATLATTVSTLNTTVTTLNTTVTNLTALTTFTQDNVTQLYYDLNVERNRINSLDFFAGNFLGGSGSFTASSGVVNIPHGLSSTPDDWACTAFIGAGGAAYLVSVSGTTSTNLVLYVQDTAGVAIGGSVNIVWSAHL